MKTCRNVNGRVYLQRHYRLRDVNHSTRLIANASDKLHEHSKFLSVDVERHMAETALAQRNKSFAQKIREGRRDSPAYDINRLDFVVARINRPERQIPLEVPMRSKLHKVVSKGTMLQRDIVDPHLSECRGEVGIFRGIAPFAPRTAAADVKADPNAGGEFRNQFVQNVGCPTALMGEGLHPWGCHSVAAFNI